MNKDMKNEDMRGAKCYKEVGDIIEALLDGYWEIFKDAFVIYNPSVASLSQERDLSDDELVGERKCSADVVVLVSRILEKLTEIFGEEQVKEMANDRVYVRWAIKVQLTIKKGCAQG